MSGKISNEMLGDNSINRRNFLKGALATGALAAGGVAIAGLAGCNTPQDSGSTDGSDSTAAVNNGSDAPTGEITAAGTTTIGGAICATDWLGTMPVIAESDVSETVDVDIVVLGGGHAGTQAALAATQAGSTVAVVEKQSDEDYVYYGDDICGYNSKWITEKGFGGYNTGAITAEYCRRGIGRVSPEIIKLFVENSGETFDNMISLVPETSDMLDMENGRCIIQTAYGKNNGSDYPIEQSGYKSWATTVQTIATVNPTEVIPGRRLTRLTELETYHGRTTWTLGNLRILDPQLQRETVHE